MAEREFCSRCGIPTSLVEIDDRGECRDRDACSARLDGPWPRPEHGEPIDVVEFVHGSGAHVDADGVTRAGAPTWEVDGRLATSWDYGLGRAFDVWVDEIPLLEQDTLLYGNVYLVKGRSAVCDRIDPECVTVARAAPPE